MAGNGKDTAFSRRLNANTEYPQTPFQRLSGPLPPRSPATRDRRPGRQAGPPGSGLTQAPPDTGPCPGTGRRQSPPSPLACRTASLIGPAPGVLPATGWSHYRGNCRKQFAGT